MKNIREKKKEIKIKGLKLLKKDNVVFESPKHATTFVTISRDEYESMKNTIEVLSDKELMEQIRKSMKAVSEGRFRKWSDIAKEKGIV